jgi:hypothetical protein
VAGDEFKVLRYGMTPITVSRADIERASVIKIPPGKLTEDALRRLSNSTGNVVQYDATLTVLPKECMDRCPLGGRHRPCASCPAGPPQ